MKYVSLPWPLLEAALSVFILSIFLKKNIFEKELIKTKKIAISAES
jgi:hypothetical protein